MGLNFMGNNWELLEKLIKDEVKSKFRTNVVKQKRFSEMLKATLNKYDNRAIEAAQVIEELIETVSMYTQVVLKTD